MPLPNPFPPRQRRTSAECVGHLQDLLAHSRRMAPSAVVLSTDAAAFATSMIVNALRASQADGDKVLY